MARYVDGYVLPVPKRNLAAYRRLSRACGKVWKKHGALDYCECVGDDLAVKGLVAFPKLAKARRGETVMFSFIVFKSRAHRDRVNAKAMADPRITGMMNKPAPFDCTRMAYGGFKVLLRA